MAIITLICKQCGGQLNLPDDKEFAFCQHCGTKVIIKDEITNISNTYNTQNITKNVFVTQNKEASQWVDKGKKLLDLAKKENAMECFVAAVDEDPACWEAWYLMAENLDKCGKKYFDENKKEYTSLEAAWNAYTFAPDDETKAMVKKIIVPVPGKNPNYGRPCKGLILKNYGNDKAKTAVALGHSLSHSYFGGLKEMFDFLSNLPQKIDISGNKAWDLYDELIKNGADVEFL